MKKSLLVPLVLLIAACASPDPEVVVVKITSTPILVTTTPLPTDTPLPTNTPEPTSSPTPAWEPIEIPELEVTLRDNGYRRYPIVSGSGRHGFTWIKENAYERLSTWEDGIIEIEVFHDKSPSVRSEYVEKRLSVFDEVSPAGFMAKLREEHETYNESVGPKVSGDPSNMYTYGDNWKIIDAEYNVEETEVGDYYVRFSLWWWQSTCPSKYLYCYYEDFPGLEFTGDSSFTFHTILLIPMN